MFFRRLTIVLALAFLPAFSRGEVAPFGLSVGSASLQDVRAYLNSKSTVKELGTNKWTHGVVLEASGNGLGIEELKSALFIFSAQQKLVGIFLTLPKTRFESIKTSLQSKYKLVSAETPFVGNKSATFRDGPVTIKASAPHLSFDMEVSYLHAEFQAAFNKAYEAEQKQKQNVQTQSL